ncbi:MAG: hypothetical protein AAGC49_10550 [Brevundimonas sp.]
MIVTHVGAIFTYMQIVVLLATVAIFVLGIVGIVVGSVLLSRARSVPRVQVPARLVSRQSAGAGDVMLLEFPGPDGAPRQAEVFAAAGRGVGATPLFDGLAWVNPRDLADVALQPEPQGDAGPGWTVLVIGIVLTILGATVLMGGLLTFYLTPFGP